MRKAINDRVGKMIYNIKENRSKKQAATAAKLRDCQGKEGGGSLSRLQEELADVQRKLSVYETQMGLNILRLSDLMKEKMDMQKEMDGLQCKLRESEDRCVWSEGQVDQLKSSSESNQREEQGFHKRLYNIMLRALGMARGFRQQSSEQGRHRLQDRQLTEEMSLLELEDKEENV
ncbi:hypothetical protein AAFF_G00243100 [Aldrovandia affinis]|uniref:Uncharacterized protein n=1 Tax=Aldrovandia affinis TaxID=143900 RepID=A0AAD7RDX9_9TELE|nr:hypothetical protein AAFF_G00243100 [Aldrovandia affinis]